MQSPDVETVQVCVLYVCICVSGSVSTFVRLLVCAHVCMCSCQCVGAQACVCVPIQVLSIWSGPDRSSPYSLSSLSLSLGFPDWTRLGASELQGSVCLPGPRLELTSELCLTFFFLFFFFLPTLVVGIRTQEARPAWRFPHWLSCLLGSFFITRERKYSFYWCFHICNIIMPFDCLGENKEKNYSSTHFQRCQTGGHLLLWVSLQGHRQRGCPQPCCWSWTCTSFLSLCLSHFHLRYECICIVSCPLSVSGTFFNYQVKTPGDRPQ